MKHRLKITLFSIATIVILAFHSFIPVYAITQDEMIELMKENGAYDESLIGFSGAHPELYVGDNKFSNVGESNNYETTTKSSQNAKQPKKCNHEYQSEITKESTCTEAGVNTYTCTKCKDKYTEEIPMTEHSYEEKVTKEAICTEVGEVTYICSVCEDSYTEELSATGHTESEWNISKEATCTGSGERRIACADCSETLKTEEIPVIEHTAGSWEIEQKATLISTGIKVQKCTVCDEILNTASIPINMTVWYIIGGTVICLAIVSLVIVKVVKKKR